MRPTNLICLAFCSPWKSRILASISSMAFFVSPSFLDSWITSYQLLMQRSTKPRSLSRTFRMRASFTPTSLFSMNAKRASSESLSSRSYRCRTSLSALLPRVTPSQLLRVLFSRALSLPWARPMSADLFLLLWLAVMVPSWFSTAMSCCRAYSAYLAELSRRSSRLSMLARQAAPRSARHAASLLASTTDSFTMRCTIVSDSAVSSMIWATDSSSSSKAVRTRHMVFSITVSSVVRISKLSHMVGGILSVSSPTSVRSSARDMKSISSLDRGTPFTAIRSSAVDMALSRFHAFPSDDRMIRNSQPSRNSCT
mmetsp:Transcript_98034/g.255496  ORF Transcript_98034/g.255496 Transcript_98034/m.255496 type:complete len:311 (+) Transcript_98034:703-1635(+)